MQCLITPITSPRTVINQQQSAFVKTLDPLPERTQAGSLAVHFAQIGRLPVDIPTLPACLPLSSEIARAWAACAASTRGSSAVHASAAYFETNRHCHPGQGCTPNLATRRPSASTLDRSKRAARSGTGDNGLCVRIRSWAHKLSPTEGARSASCDPAFPPIQLPRCSGERRDSDPGLNLLVPIVNTTHPDQLAQRGEKQKEIPESRHVVQTYGFVGGSAASSLQWLARCVRALLKRSWEERGGDKIVSLLIRPNAQLFDGHHMLVHVKYRAGRFVPSRMSPAASNPQQS